MALAALLGPSRGPPCYRTVEHPRRSLAGHEVRTLAFDLPMRAWDLSSMFFVADGMTTH